MTAVVVTMFAPDFYKHDDDFEVFATADAAMGRLARQHRRELDYKTVDEVGEQSDENTVHCNAVISSF